MIVNVNNINYTRTLKKSKRKYIFFTRIFKFKFACVQSPRIKPPQYPFIMAKIRITDGSGRNSCADHLYCFCLMSSCDTPYRPAEQKTNKIQNAAGLMPMPESGTVLKYKKRRHASGCGSMPPVDGHGKISGSEVHGSPSLRRFQPGSCRCRSGAAGRFWFRRRSSPSSEPPSRAGGPARTSP